MPQAAPAFETSAVPPPAPPPARRRPLVARMLFVVTLLLGLWIGWQEGPREIARWHLAAAVEHRANASYHRRHGRSALADRHALGAQAAMQRALAWNSDCADAFVIRAGWHSQEGRFQRALEDYDRALKLGADSIDVYERRSTLYLQMKRFREAVDDQLAVYEQVRSRWRLKNAVPGQLNQVAYFRAVGRQDLRQALKEIDEALSSLKKPTDELSHEERSELMAFLDTRGYILYLLDRPKEAINDMDEAAKLAQLELSEFVAQRRQRLHGAVDLREFETREAGRSYNLGVIFYHRSLVLDKLKHKNDALKDRHMARQLLGREPDESVF